MRQVHGKSAQGEQMQMGDQCQGIQVQSRLSSGLSTLIGRRRDRNGGLMERLHHELNLPLRANEPGVERTVPTQKEEVGHLPLGRSEREILEQRMGFHGSSPLGQRVRMV